jgi:putative membrane protein
MCPPGGHGCRPVVATGNGAHEERTASKGWNDMEPVAYKPISDDMSTELSSRRTGMSFQRTRMSTDRTTMSVIRTSLSLIGFGFTIFQFFEKLKDAGTLRHASSPRHFGIALVLLGILMLIGGIIYHMQFMYGLRMERKAMAAAGLIHAQSHFPVSLTLITACLLLALGVVAIVSMVFQVGPFN